MGVSLDLTCTASHSLTISDLTLDIARAIGLRRTTCPKEYKQTLTVNELPVISYFFTTNCFEV